MHLHHWSNILSSLSMPKDLGIVYYVMLCIPTATEETVYEQWQH